MKKNILLLLLIVTGCLTLHAQDDPYLWLEDIDGVKSLEFVTKQSKATFDTLSKLKEYQDIYNKSLEVYNSTDNIPYPEGIYGGYLYNFWKDKDHIRGIWRRTTKQSYISENPEWETLLDLDELSEKDHEKWVFKGINGLYPDYNLFLVYLSKGGGDASVIREFDVSKKSFVENGFSLDESKGSANYLDENALIVSRSEENNMTTSGYPEQVKIWKRGTPFKDAQTIYEGKKTDLGTWGFQLRDGDIKYTMISRKMTFYTSQTFIWQNDKLIKLDIPDDSQFSALLHNQLILELKSDWNIDGTTYKEGSLISLNFTELLADKKEAHLIFQPDEFSSVSELNLTKNNLLVNVLSNVKSELFNYFFDNNKWVREKVDAPDFGTIDIIASDGLSDLYYFSFQNFLKPTTLFVADAKENSIEACKSLPQYFDGTNYQVEQYKAKSKDGTLIPYFVVSSKSMKKDGKNPTLLEAYGGFEVSYLPFYMGNLGNGWLGKGGVYVLANIRGGGEFGPRWHQAGIKEKRQNVYDDFYAVSEDLIAKGITSSEKLGIIGGSNGGLLVGVAFTQHPELYKAVVCLSPLLDMRRYNKLLAGASWMGEYGDPDKPEDWEYIKKYSPYQNLKKGMNYPEVFFYTSTKDDRVHPGHARKMAAKMIDMGYPVLFFENTEGGHAGISTNEQRAKRTAMELSYLLMKLK